MGWYVAWQANPARACVTALLFHCIEPAGTLPAKTALHLERSDAVAAAAGNEENEAVGLVDERHALAGGAPTSFSSR